MKKILVSFVFLCSIVTLAFPQVYFSPEIKRVAVFKNGYAFTYRETQTQTDKGWAYTGNAPIGVLGTVWGYSTTPNIRVMELRTSESEKQETQRITNLTEFLVANEGSQIRAEVLSGDSKIKVYQGTYEIISPLRGFNYPSGPILNNGFELAENRNSLDMAIALKTETGTLVFLASKIENVEIIGQAKWTKPKLAKQNLLGIKTEGAADGQTINLGVAALERGIRWIPAYRVEVKGTPIKEAKLELEANLINELADLKNTEMYFVVGVPHFLFQDSMSPLSMNTAFAGVSGYFNTSGNDRNLNISARQMSNLIVTDSNNAYQNATPSPTVINDEQLNSFSAEQLFLYQANAITLKKGERSSLRLFSLTVPCSEVFEWTVNDAPDTQRRYLDYSGNSNSQPLIQDLSTQVWYALRLKNSTGMPWTTAPAITFRDWKPIGQDMLTFTPIGGDNVLRVTPATEVIGSQTLEEKSREKAQINYNGSMYNFDLITIEGKLKLRNVKKEAVEMVLTRNLVGEVITAGDGGKISKEGLNLQMVNPNSVVKWNLTLPSGEKEITYTYKVYIRR